MIYDCFLYSGEIDMLNIAMNELEDLNVRHVIVQSNKTFTGHEKDVNYFINDTNTPIIPIYVFDMPEGNNPWEREKFQRNAIMRGLTDAKDDDLVIIRDADEIPSAESIMNCKPELGVTSFVMHKFGYYLNCVEGYESWKIAKILTYRELKKSTPDEIRNGGYGEQLHDGGWHFSYCGGIDAVIRKFNSFSHQEPETQKVNNRKILTDKIETCQSLWGDDFWKVVPVDSTFPLYVQKNANDSLKHLIKEWNTTAGS